MCSQNTRLQATEIHQFPIVPLFFAKCFMSVDLTMPVDFGPHESRIANDNDKGYR